MPLSPSQLSTGLRLLLDPASLALADAASAVGTPWPDLSGQGNNGTIAGVATYRTGVFGTANGVRLVGASGSVSGTFAAWTSGPLTLLMSVNNYTTWPSAPGTNTAYGFAAFAASGANNDYDNSTSCVVQSTSITQPGGQANVYSGGASFASAYTSFGWTQVPQVWGIVIGSTTLSYWINGRKVYSAAKTNSSLNPLRWVLGNRWNSGAVSTTGGSNFDMGIWAVYQGALSDAAMLADSTVLMQAQGISSGGGAFSILGNSIVRPA